MKKLLKTIAAVLTITWVVSEVISVIELIRGKRGWHKPHKPYGIYERFIKRPLDIFISIIALLLLWPVMVVIALLVRVKLGSPVLFTQDRPGLNEKVFKLYKFRTMTDERDENGELLPDEVRLTKFGKWLRATSLDELPELINIFKGDMSIIGPRPLLVEYLPYYTKEERRRHDVRPGLTGLAQVRGRNNLTWEQKFEYDIWYVDHVSLKADIRIVIDSVRAVLSHKDVTLNALEDFDDYRKHSADTDN